MFPTKSSPFTHPLLGGLVPRPPSSRKAWDSPSSGTSSCRPRPHPPRPSPLRRPRGDPGRPRRGAQAPPQCSAAGAGDAGGRGSPGAGEPRLAGRGGGAGDVEGTWWCLGEEGFGEGGTGGRGRSWAAEAPPRGGPAAGPVIPLAAPPDPRRASDSGSRPPPPPLPGPGTTPNPRGRGLGGSGCSIPARLPPPSVPSPPDVWTTLGPHRLRKPSPPGSAAGRAPPSLQSPQASSRPDFRLPLDPRPLFPPSPSPAWSGVGGRGERPAPSPPP